MKVKELIKKLEKLDGDKEIYYDDYGDGYMEINGIEPGYIFNYEAEWDDELINMAGSGKLYYEDIKNKGYTITECKDIYVMGYRQGQKKNG